MKRNTKYAVVEVVAYIQGLSFSIVCYIKDVIPPGLYQNKYV